MLISLCVSNLCLFKERKNLTLKTCAPDFSARSMSKLYAKIKGVRAISLFDFPKTWQVCMVVVSGEDVLKPSAWGYPKVGPIVLAVNGGGLFEFCFLLLVLSHCSIATSLGDGLI